MYVGVILLIYIYLFKYVRIPHVRGGDPREKSIALHKELVFPMYVGVILFHGNYTQDIVGIPHVRGGDPKRPFFILKPPIVFPMYVGVIPPLLKWWA